MNMKTMTFVCCCLTGTLASAFPSVSGVSISPLGKRAEISYRLSEPAVVTVSFETNGVALPPETTWWVYGDVNEIVTGAVGRILWRPPAGLQADSVKPVLTAWSTNNTPPYLAIDLQPGRTSAVWPVRYYASSNSVPGGVTAQAWKTTHMLFKKVEPTAGFRMGSGPEEDYQGPNEKPAMVKLSKPFYLGVYELTQSQWVRLSGQVDASNTLDGSERAATALPYTWIRGKTNGVYWPDVQEPDGDDTSVAAIFRTRCGLLVDVPTEAQWEYAVRAGTTSAAYFDHFDGTSFKSWVWYKKNTTETSDVSGKNAHRVGQFPPNPWGFYDMLGNVWEWARDRYLEDRSTLSQQTDPAAPTSSSNNFTIRGGSFCEDTIGVDSKGKLAGSVRCASRYPVKGGNDTYNVGVRFSIDLP